MQALTSNIDPERAGLGHGDTTVYALLALARQVYIDQLGREPNCL